MQKSAREVVARYLGQNAEDDGLPWMEHLEKTQEKLPGFSNMVRALAPAVLDEDEDGELSDHNKAQDVGKSLQDDIIDPKSMAREQDGPAVRSDVEDLESGTIPITHFNTPDMYGPNSSLKEWWAAREREDLATGTAFGQQTTGLPVEASVVVPMVHVGAGTAYEEIVRPMFSKEAKSLQQIINSNTHTKRSITERRGENLSPQLVSTPDEMKRGILHFKMRTPQSPTERHVVLQFLRKPNGVVSSDPVRENDCLIGCTCPAFLFWGPQYYAVEGQYMYKDLQRETIGTPDGANHGAIVAPGAYVPATGKGKGSPTLARGEGGTFCKHIYAAYLAAKSLSYKIDPAALAEHEESLLDKGEDSSLQSEHLDQEMPATSTYQQFQKYVMDPVIPEELKKFVSELHDSHGSNISKLDEFIVSPWNSWMGNQSGEEVAMMLKTMDQWKTAPSVLAYVLKKSVPVVKRAGKSIPPAVLRKAYRIVKKWL